MLKTAGEICERRDDFLLSRFNWRIPNVKSVLRQFGDTCHSPPFVFCDGDWTLKMIRSVQTKLCHCVAIHIKRNAKGFYHKNGVKIKLMKINSNGEENLLSRYNTTADERFWKGSVIFDFATKTFSWLEQTVFDLEVICYLSCFDCKTLSKCFDGLGRDLLNLLNSGEDSDVTIKVKDRVFKVHRNIIGARSPVFLAMFTHDMIERRNGSVDITDCEPEVFQKFLEYIYSGELKDLSENIACNLYYIADKYGVLGAKAECVEFLSKNISLEFFCDIAALATCHGEEALFKIANQFFEDNSKAIIESESWVSFLTENPVATAFLRNLR